MDIPKKTKSPITAKIKAAKALKKIPAALLLKKKAECDAKALRIVEQMIEPEINVDWLLQNLGQINRAHMDDIVEERSIVKLCGYPLCDNPLKKVVRKQYQISTLRNKVYDISRVKNFCSYRCYTATEYLMEQMLTSPLWIREDEEIPKFQILPKTQSRCKSPPGVEVDLMGIKLPDDTDDQEKLAANESKEKGMRKSSSSAKKVRTQESGGRDRQKSDGKTNKVLANESDEKECQEIDTNIEKEPINDSELKKMHESAGDFLENALVKETKEKETKESDESCSIAKDDEKIEETGTKERLMDVETSKDQLRVEIDRKMPLKEEVEEKKFPDVGDRKLTVTFSPNVHEEQNELSTSIPTNSESSFSQPVAKLSSENRRNERRKTRESKKKAISFETLTKRVEDSLKEWITEETICLLYGEETEKRKLHEIVSRQEKYAVLCKKLNHLQLEEEREDTERIGELKPAPQFSELQKEAKNLELKVRAFYEGRTVIDRNAEKAVDSTKQEEKEPEIAQLPLLDIHAPKALRRRIFLEKLNRVLPDLLRALAGSGQSSSTQYSYTSERCAAVKALVSTFSLSATNIIFKTAEWTLVALIIIKLLSFMDPKMKYLLSSKQASMYISMILMSYKLNSNYLETLIASTASPSKTTMEKDS